METFQEAALQMLREFRVLLQHSPVPLNANRFLQLLALNMFAIENTQLKESQMEPGYRSAVQESALVVSLEMFSLVLERCVSLLRDQLSQPSTTTNSRLIHSEDVQIVLPAIKVWCDWLLCHSSVWNPPPSCADYRVGSPGNAWSRLADLVNLLERLDHEKAELFTGSREGYEPVRLPEDATLCGFTPLMYNSQDPMFSPKETNTELAQDCLRLRKILFFGTVFLCGVDPPVLKLQKFDKELSQYVSVVETPDPVPTSIPAGCFMSQSDTDMATESLSEQGVGSKVGEAATPSEIRSLLHRREELERRHLTQEKHHQHVQAILKESVVSVEIEVRPRYLVPDTNCFIDYLNLLQRIARTYTLMVPLVVLNELDGLARGGRDRPRVLDDMTELNHAVKVAESAKAALSFLRARHSTVRCVTSRGTVLSSSTFTMEEDGDREARNDDRILATCLSLCREKSDPEPSKPGELKRLYREVVLLTEDRNLRVKALARDVPVRELPDFMQWAGLG